MGNKPKGDITLTKTIGVRCTEEVHALYKAMADGPDYIIRCVMTRDTGTAEAKRRQAQHKRRIAQDLMLEASALDKEAEAAETTDIVVMDRPARQAYIEHEIWRRPQVGQENWLMDVQAMSLQEAVEFIEEMREEREGVD